MPTVLSIQGGSQLRPLEWQVLFEHLPSTLGQEIQTRRAMSKQGRSPAKASILINDCHFQEAHIVSMIDCVLSALMAFHFKELAHGDLRPETIFKRENEHEDVVYCVGLPLLLNPYRK